MKVMTRCGYFDEFAQMLCLDDNMFAMLRANPGLMHDRDFLLKNIDADGDHAVFVRIELIEEFDIRKAIEYVLVDYKSVSWYRNGRFFTYYKKGVNYDLRRVLSKKNLF